MSAASSPFPVVRARTTYRVYATDVSKVVCHRQRHGVGKPPKHPICTNLTALEQEEQYLVIWKTTGTGRLTPPGAAASWHSVAELERSLHHVQTYIEGLGPRSPTARSATLEAIPETSTILNRKRKAPGADPVTNANGTASRSDPGGTPKDSAYFSREASVASLRSDSSLNDPAQPMVYNAVLQKREGRLVARKVCLLHVSPAVHFIDSVTAERDE